MNKLERIKELEKELSKLRKEVLKDPNTDINFKVRDVQKNGIEGEYFCWAFNNDKCKLLNEVMEMEWDNGHGWNRYETIDIFDALEFAIQTFMDEGKNDDIFAFLKEGDEEYIEEFAGEDWTDIEYVSPDDDLYDMLEERIWDELMEQYVINGHKTFKADW